tara:strand:+ start:95 stop:208 length:114 start_codon:yes stop_codon:yes gene_type:complete
MVQAVIVVGDYNMEMVVFCLGIIALMEFIDWIDKRFK